MENQAFKKGDTVPEWIEKTENYEMVFGVDVTVEKTSEGVNVYPNSRLNGNEYVMIGTAIEKDKPWSVSGAPTMVYSNPMN